MKILYNSKDGADEFYKNLQQQKNYISNVR